MAFLSCEKAIDLNIPEDPPRLTMDVRIIDDGKDSTLITALAGISAYSLSSDDPRRAEEAELFLYENGVLAGPMDDPNLLTTINKTHAIRYPLKEGARYRVEGRHPKFPFISGEDVLPSHIPIDSFSATLPENDVAQLEFYFTDPVDGEDFYQLKGEKIFYSINAVGDTTGVSSTRILFETNDPLMEFFDGFAGVDIIGGSSEKQGQVGYLRDESFNGKSKPVSVGLRVDLFQSDPAVYEIEFTHISKSFYRHEKSKALNSGGDGNIFQEPSSLFLNVENGYGIVAAGAVSKIEIKR